MAETTEAIRTTGGKLRLHMSFKKTKLMSIGKVTSIHLLQLFHLEVSARGGSQIWIGRAAGSSGPIPMFRGNFSRKGTHVLGIFPKKGTHF